MNNISKIHHYIPQFLSKKWCGSDKKLWYHKWVSGKLISKKISPTNTAYEKFLYPPNIEEKIMKKIDNDAAKVINIMIDNDLSILKNKHRKSMASFITSLWLRTPEEVSKNNILGQTILENQMNEGQSEYEIIRSNEDPATLSEALIKYYPGIFKHFGFMASLGFMIGEKGYEEIQNEILKMHWKVINFSDINSNLILSDNPCIRLTGFASSNCLIALPLSPKHVFLAGYDELVIKQIK